MAKATKVRQPQKFPASNKDYLLSAERARELDPDFILGLLPLEPFHLVADIGCGPGYFSVALAMALTGGHVYGVDVQEEMVKACRQLLRRAKTTNAEVLLSEESTLPFEDKSLDGAFMAFAFHEAWDRPALLQEVYRVLKPSGWLTMIEWLKDPMDEGPPLEDRLSALECLDLAEPLGFRLLDHALLNEKHYLVTFRRMEPPRRKRRKTVPPPQKAKNVVRQPVSKARGRAGTKGKSTSVAGRTTRGSKPAPRGTRASRR